MRRHSTSQEVVRIHDANPVDELATASVEVMGSRNGTIARLSFRYMDPNGTPTEIVVFGAARKHPDDPWDPTIGAELAIGRAFSKVGRRMEKRAAGYIRDLEHLQADKKRREDAQAAGTERPKKFLRRRRSRTGLAVRPEEALTAS